MPCSQHHAPQPTSLLLRYNVFGRDPSRNLAAFEVIQSNLEGENLRVFSIGGQKFCFHLKTSKLGHRDGAEVEVLQVEMPAELVNPTTELVRKIG